MIAALPLPCTIYACLLALGEQGRLNLSDDAPEVVNLVLVYLYMKDYDLEAEVPDGFSKTVKLQGSTQAAKARSQANESQNVMFCCCSRSVEEEEMVKCEDCNTWQHTFCYYANGLSPSVHFCEGYAAKSHSSKELKLVTVYEELDRSLRVTCNLCHHEHPIV